MTLNRMPGAKPVKRRRLYEEVAANLEEMILSGELKVGDSLPSERDLMDAFQVGRPAVREALFALQKMGLVAIGNGERARVSRPTTDGMISELSGAARHLLASPEGVRHFQHARKLFEISLARYAAQHASDTDIERLRSALEANRAAIGRNEEWVETDVAFHFVLAEIPGNPIYTALHIALSEWLKEQRATAVQVRGSQRAAFQAHERIFEAVASRDPDAAEAAMSGHLSKVADDYWQVARHA